METKGLEFKYNEIGGFEFNQIIQKISNTPTTAEKAGQIRSVVKAVQKLRDKVSEDYKKDILGTYFQKNEDGTPKKAEGGGEFIPLAGKETEITKANDEFGARVGTIELEGCRPLTPNTLSDMKITARELELLKDLYTEQNGPGVPHMPFPTALGSNAPQMRQ